MGEFGAAEGAGDEQAEEALVGHAVGDLFGYAAFGVNAVGRIGDQGGDFMRSFDVVGDVGLCGCGHVMSWLSKLFGLGESQVVRGA